MPRGVTVYQRGEHTMAAEAAAELLRVSSAQFASLARETDFPRPTAATGEPKWFPSELIAWREQRIFRQKFIAR